MLLTATKRLTTSLPTKLRPAASNSTSFISSLTRAPTAIRTFTSSQASFAKDPKMSSGPPKHEMAYFPNMTTSLPSTSSEFRRVLWTGLYSQVVLMTVPVGGDIGDEVHTVDQALTFTSGTGKATINGKDQDVKAGDLMVVPAGKNIFHLSEFLWSWLLMYDRRYAASIRQYGRYALDPLHDLLACRA